jgi:outer membrane immunogenic protein
MRIGHRYTDPSLISCCSVGEGSNVVKNILVAAAAFLTLSGGAYSADLPARQAPPLLPVALPVFTWTGFYIGAQVGAAWQQDRLEEIDVCTPGCVDRATGRSTGIIGGGHVGFNWQAGAVVYGLEGDFEGTDLHHSTVYPLSAPDRFSSNIRWQSSVRGRLGYAFDRVLIYGTGGVAFADIRHRYYEATAPASQSFSDTRTGWTAGGGVEYALGGNWSTRVEYRYTDFGKKTDVPDVVFPRFVERHAETEHAVRVGVSYRFW